MRVLIVDDLQENLTVLRAILKMAGHEALSARDGAEALELLKSERPDLIISDIMMPVMDGFQLCRRVKTDERFRGIPFIIYTATYTDAEDEAFALRIGADRFIAKPCEHERFLAIIREVMASAADGRSAPRELSEEDVLRMHGERLGHKLQQKVRQAEREVHYRALFEYTVDAFLLTTANGSILDANPAACRIFGRSLEELLQGGRNALVDPTDPRLEAALEERARIGRARAELRLLRADGTTFPAEVTSVLFTDANGVQRSSMIIRDITEQKRAAEALARSEAKFRTLFQDNAAIMLIIDLEQGRIADANESAARFYGWPVERLCRMNISEINTLPFSKLREIMASISMPSRNSFEFQHRKADGTIADIESYVSRIQLEDREYLFSIVHDITERKRLETQLLQAQRMESVGRLAGGVAHDFNNLLGVIIGYAEMALSKIDASDPLHADLTEIHEAATRSARVTQQLLAFARKQAIHPVVIDLNASVEKMLKMLRRLIGENITLSWLPGADPCQVQIDLAQLDQILINLCANARDAIRGAGRITIETARATQAEWETASGCPCPPGDYVVLRVRDDGMGMSPESLSHLFEPFYTTKDLGKGTGLGLATVYGIVRQNGGYIDVHSQPGSGTSFSICLPRHDAAQTPTAREEQPRAGAGETVLVVEDDSALLKVICRVLEKAGYSILEANGAEMALEIARTSPRRIDLILTDMVLPTFLGWELAEKMRALYPEIRVIYMSGYMNGTAAGRVGAEPGSGFLQKPFSLRTLSDKVREILSK
ncbi:MAG TPA: response regulator [Candidatus Ozemobacteraceae bacterium]